LCFCVFGCVDPTARACLPPPPPRHGPTHPPLPATPPRGRANYYQHPPFFHPSGWMTQLWTNFSTDQFSSIWLDVSFYRLSSIWIDVTATDEPNFFIHWMILACYDAVVG
jgi:hypothetical protein